MPSFLSTLPTSTRIDTRQQTTLRTYKTTILSPKGVQIQIGKTNILVSLSSEIVKPKYSSEGILEIHCVNTINESLESLESLLEMSLKKSRVVDLEGLVIIRSQAVWNIRVDVRVLCDDGSVGPASHFGALVALSRYTLNEVTVYDNRLTVHDLHDKIGRKLAMLHYPILVSFCVLNGSHLIDPSAEEETEATTMMHILANEVKELIGFKMYGKAISKEGILKNVKNASVIAKNVGKLMKDAIAME